MCSKNLNAESIPEKKIRNTKSGKGKSFKIEFLEFKNVFQKRGSGSIFIHSLLLFKVFFLFCRIIFVILQWYFHHFK